MIEAVIFDWGGTLTPWHTIDLHEQWRHYAQAYDQDGAEELAGRLLEQERQMWAAARVEQRSATLDGLFAAAGVDVRSPRHAPALAAYELFWEPHTHTDPEAAPLLRGLRERGVRVGVLSNTLWTREFHERVFARDEILELIDGATYSSEIPYTKPHPEAFLAAMRSVGATDPSRCLFVGDRPFDDIHGARAVGLRAALVPHSAIPAEQRGEVEGEPDAVVVRLGDVLALLERWSP